MDVKLKVLVGKNAGQELAVPGPKFFVGRAEDCQLRPRSDLISRHHCVLLIEESFVAVRDFGSKNGTLVNNERVTGERELKHGDRLVIGPLEFEVVVHVPAPSKKRPKVESVKEAAARTAEGHPGGDKLDVSQWLGDGDSKAGHADTRVINMNETGELDLGNGHAKPAADEAAVEPAAEPEPVAARQTVAAKAAPGKLPAAAKAAQDDSRSAAADVLNKFFKRR
ncbi:MAG TPA: FHA domain-containing protein [Pirellulales bacterium]